ncbi:MAG TPA: hypothetical protein VHJ54_11280 [Solirubrobacterales bacterium]|nr:hypothetical protein [Solirubrobacterales bacterium]
MADELGREPADQERLLRLLIRHAVEFLVLGGIAVYIHGYTRLTEGVDLLPDPSAANMRRLAGALGELEAVAVGTGGCDWISICHTLRASRSVTTFWTPSLARSTSSTGNGPI